MVLDKTFDSTYRELRLLELTSVNFYTLLVMRACWWYPWTTTKVVGVRTTSGELPIGNGSDGWRRFGLLPSWVQLELNSRRTTVMADSLAVMRRWLAKRSSGV